MSSFFTLPASQKRKRGERSNTSQQSSRRPISKDDESISGSDDSGDDLPSKRQDELGSEDDEDDDEEFADEDPAAKRIRLAEQYLANTQQEVLEDGGFDAAEIDKENLSRRMGQRLKQDTAESKGKLYRWLASDLDWQRSRARRLRYHHVGKSYTGVAMQGRYLYAVTKDMHLVKWELPDFDEQPSKGRRSRGSPRIIGSIRGNRKSKAGDGHHGAILCIAASPDGKFIATGGSDKKLVIWDAATLNPLKTFTHHRDCVTAVAFRRGSNQLFSTSKDRTVKTWSLDELAYVETLFGHQDEVVDVDALGQEQCVTVGARDRTARWWKVVEESQLVFRGGGAPVKSKSIKSLRSAYEDDAAPDLPEELLHHEGSIERVVMIDDETFVTGSDNGSLALWDTRKKKSIFTVPFAHGLDPALTIGDASAEVEPREDSDERSRGGKRPRWITALKAIPFSNLILSGSWDGHVRAWRITDDKRQIESLGAITSIDHTQSFAAGIRVDTLASFKTECKGFINDLAILETGNRGKDGLLVAAAVGTDHRLGHWNESRGSQSIAVMLFRVPQKATAGHEESVNESLVQGPSNVAHDENFAGFD